MSDILRDAYNACSYGPLEADDPRRVDLHALGVRGSGRDPMRRLQQVIKAADKPTQQLFSGFTGSGKSTELKKLAASLKCAGYTPVLIDCENYLNVKVPPRTNDLLATAAAGVDEYIQHNCKDRLPKPFKSYWDRFSTFLSSEVKLEGINLSGIEVKLQDVSFKTKLYEGLEQANRLQDWSQQCHQFLIEATAVVSKACPSHKGLVIIVDSFEKVRSDYAHADEVRHAVETIFIRDWKLLCLPCHVIYTVPSWLTFCEFGAAAELGRICILPMCRLVDQYSGKRVPEGFAAMRAILEKRMPLDSMLEDVKPLDDMIAASGGYPRDFLRMMREVLLTAMMDKIGPPIPAEDLKRLIAEVIESLGYDYDKPIFDEDLPLLMEVAKTRDVPRSERREAFRLAELFDSHFVLGYRNGKEWYDLHPLVRRSPKVKKALEKANGNKNQE